MDNITRKHLLAKHRQSGFPGSILDVFKAYDQGIDLIGQFEQQNNIQTAQTPNEQQQGLRPAHQAGDVNQSMIFPNVPPNTAFNTVGMKEPINIEKYNEQGHLVKSYENVPPGVQNLPTGPQKGTVLETPANMQSGGPIKHFQKRKARHLRDDMGYQENPDGSRSTHLMMSGDNYAWPSIYPTSPGNYEEQTFDEALERGEMFEFKNEKQADRFARGSWKTPRWERKNIDKKQTGGAKWQDTSNWVDTEYGPDQYGDTLNLNTLDLISEHRQGIKQPWAVRDTIAYHETGNHQRMQPNAVQISTNKGKLVPGTGRGKYQYDQPSTLTAANRVHRISSYMGLETPSFIQELRDTKGTDRADTLTSKQQDMLYMGDLIQGDAPGVKYGKGDATIEDLWYQGHNRRTDEKKARGEFQESMRGLQTDTLSNYNFMAPKPNYFDVKKQRHGGATKKYFKLRK